MYFFLNHGSKQNEAHCSVLTEKNVPDQQSFKGLHNDTCAINLCMAAHTCVCVLVHRSRKVWKDRYNFKWFLLPLLPREKGKVPGGGGWGTGGILFSTFSALLPTFQRSTSMCCNLRLRSSPYSAPVRAQLNIS